MTELKTTRLDRYNNERRSSMFWINCSDPRKQREIALKVARRAWADVAAEEK
jgi:hypothetical protein